MYGSVIKHMYVYVQMDMVDGLQMVVVLSTAVIAQIMQALNMSLVCVTISPTLQFYWYVIYFTYSMHTTFRVY